MRGIVAKIEARMGWSIAKLGRTWWWVAVGHNGEVLASSQVYTTASKRDQTALQVAAQLEVPFQIVK